MAAPQTQIAPELLRAIAHPQRVAILTVLDNRAMSLTALVAELQSDRTSTSRHLRALERAGLVRSAAGGTDRIYEATAMPHYDNTKWGALSNVVRREALTTSLARLQVATTTAMDAGGFDRENIHFTRTALNIGEDDFDRLSADFDQLLDRVDDVQKTTTESAVQATAVLMLFETSPSHHGTVESHDDPETFSTLEGRERAYELNERVADLIVAGDVAWDAALNAVDELRVVLSASRLAAQRERARPEHERQATPAT